MAHKVETMAYAEGVKPWHGLGYEVPGNLSPEQILQAAKLNWSVEKMPLFWKSKDNKHHKVEHEYALVRDSDDAVLSVVGSSYKPVQNSEALDFFKKFTDAGNMTMETAGSLWNGRYVWALARLGADFKAGRGDDVNGYLLLCSPHAFGYSLIIQFTAVCVVCWNTLNMALGAGLRGGKPAFRMPHSIRFDDKVKKAAETALGMGQEQMAELQEAVKVLTKAKASDEDLETYFCDVLEFNPKTAETRKDGEIKEPRMLSKLRAALTYAPGQTLATRQGTLWGGVNAVTYVVDHELGRDRSTALKGAWLGSNAALKRRALDLALKRAQ